MLNVVMPKPNLLKLRTKAYRENAEQQTLSSVECPHKMEMTGLSSAEKDNVFENSIAIKRQKHADDIETLSSNSCVSQKTMEKMNSFSACHDNEQLNYDSLTEKIRRNDVMLLKEINMTDNDNIKERPNEPSTSNNNKIKYTPLEKQVLELKELHPGMILMIQTAYKYSFFGEDAEIVSKLFNIMATRSHNLLTAVVPVFRLPVYLRKLVEEGYKVGVINQIVTSGNKETEEDKNAPFARELVNIYTKATLVGDIVDPLTDESEISQEGISTAYIMCLAENSSSSINQGRIEISFVAFDPSIGEIIYDSFEDSPCREELERRLEHLNPAEILAPTSLSDRTETILKCSSAKLERLMDDLFSFTNALISVSSFFCQDNNSGCSTGNVQSMADLPPLTVVCLSVLIHYLKQFDLDKGLKAEGLRNFSCDSRYLQMDATVLRNLEIFHNCMGLGQGSLMWALDHTKTKFGCRLLHGWLSQPLRDVAAIKSRQDAITELLDSNSGVMNILQELLTGLFDIERGLTACLHLRVGPATLYIILQTMERLRTGLQVLCPPEEKGIKSVLLQDLIKETVNCLASVESFFHNINEEAAKKGNKTYLLNDFSAFPSVLEKLEYISLLENKLDSLKFKISQQLGLSNLKYITVSNEEFLIEVKHNQIKFVPHSWRKISETKQTIRYRSPEIDVHFKELSTLREEMAKDCEAAWLNFLANFNSHYFSHKKAFKNLAKLDVLLSLVQVARLEGYCRPTLIDSDEVIISIENGRHPIIPLLFSSGDQFVANDTNLNSNEQYCMILSGPNMGGKSCYIRQVALITLMAHIGSYVPACSATISIMDAIYTRMGGRDDLFKGKSTLMIELEEAAFIIHKATHCSLVLMDELGHGTSSCDGTSLAVATLHHLLTKVKCLTLFVTHYPGVMALEHQYSGIAQNYHMSFIINDKDDEPVDILTLLYKVTHGSAGYSYGLNVARLANIPLKLLSKASEKADMLELWIDSRRREWHQFKNIWYSYMHKDTLKTVIKSLGD